MDDHTPPLNWIDGDPPSGEYNKYFWLQMEDQGGHPFVVMGHIYAVTIDSKQKETIEWVKGDRKEDAPVPTLATHIRIPELNVDSLLRDVWNIAKHYPIKRPARS